jgi:hypothetical protein
MNTYIPKQPKQTRERLEVKIDRTVIEQLDAYCRFKESERDWVVAQILGFIFRKDRAFTAWCETHGKTDGATPVA